MNQSNQISNTGTRAKQRISTKDLVLTGMFTAVISVMAQITIPIQPIPFTLQLIAVFLAGALLTPKYAFISVFVYLLLGAAGVPVFSNFEGGISRLVGPTGGYLMAFPLMSFVTALFYRQAKSLKMLALVLGMLLSLVLCYFLGTAWFTATNTSGFGFMKSLSLCVYPFIFFDTLKIALAVSLSLVIRKALKNNL